MARLRLSQTSAGAERTGTEGRADPRPERFELGGYYLDQPHPDRGGSWYACRYDKRTRRVSRRTLRTTEFEQAKIELAALVLTAPTAEGPTPGPDRVLTRVALAAYIAGHATTIRSEADAIRARDLVIQYLVGHARQPEAPVSFWTPSRQLDFCRWLHGTLGHTPASIERRLDVLCAAFNDMAAVKLRMDAVGRQVETALMTHAPKFVYKRARIAKELQVAPSRPRHNTHSIEDVGRVLDSLAEPHLFRFAILALNTWARPEAIADFEPARQFDPRTGLVDLNPPGRAQTNKRRPLIPATQGLTGWLRAWQAEDGAGVPLLMFQGRRVVSVKKALARNAAKAGVPGFTPGSFRHFMATTVRRLCRGVEREQRSAWMGHTFRGGSRTTDNYEAFDPEYLADVALATDYVVSELQRHCAKRLFAVETRLTRQDLVRLGATARQKTQGLQLVVGGR